MPKLFLTALSNGPAYELLMNGVAFFSFRSDDTPIRAVRTGNLNSCSAVIIVSEEATIAAHIAPRPDDADPNDPDAGDKHVSQKMDEMGRLYRQHRKLFSQTNSWVVYAIYNGKTALPDQKEIIESKLRQWGIIHSDVPYMVIQPPLPENGKGTVLIDGSQGGFPSVYVEDKLVNSDQSRASTQGSTSTQQQSEHTSWGGTSGGLALRDLQTVVSQHMKNTYEHEGQKLFAKDELWQKVCVSGREGHMLQSRGMIPLVD